MSLFVFNFPSNFRDTVSEIDTLMPGDEDGIWTITNPFDLTDIWARQTTFNNFGPNGTDTLVVAEDFLNGTTVFTVYDSNQQIVSQFSMATLLDLSGGFDLQAAIEALAGNPDFISTDVGNVIDSLTKTADEMIGEGTFYGRGKGDKIELEALDGSDLGASERSKAFGGGGADILKGAVQKALLNGGGGDDTLVAEFGRVAMVGGNGSDDFIFDNGFWDLTGTAAQASERSRVSIRDFDGTEDVLVFATVDDSMVFGDPVERESLEDLFGVGDLSTLANFTDDGVTYKFSENAAGDAVITRKGTDSSGRSYDERIVVKGQGLDDIDRGDVFLQDYAADTYEFF